MVAHSRVVNLYKEMGLPGEIGIVHILEGKYPFTREPADVRAAELDDTVANRFLLDATFRGDYSDGVRKNVAELLDIYGGILDIRPGDLAVMAEASRQLDFLGLNYYASHFVMAFTRERRSWISTASRPFAPRSASRWCCTVPPMSRTSW